MKKIIISLLLTCMIGLEIMPAYAEENLNAESRQQHYSAESKNPALAAGIELLGWPLALGHAYAGDWLRGMKFVAGFYIVANLYDQNTPDSYEGMFRIFLMAGVAGLWSTMDAYWTAEEYNTNLRQKHGLTVQLWNGQPALAYTYSF